MRNRARLPLSTLQAQIDPLIFDQLVTIPLSDDVWLEGRIGPVAPTRLAASDDDFVVRAQIQPTLRLVGGFGSPSPLP